MEQEKTVHQRLVDIGEIFGAGFMELPEDTVFARFSRAWRRYLEGCPLQPYSGEPLYPCGRLSLDYAVEPNYSYTVILHDDRMRKKDPGLVSVMKEQMGGNGSQVPGLHAVGGNMYTHSYPNFGRIVKEGLDSYRQRVERIASPDIRRGLLDVLEGISCYRSRALQLLRQQGADSALIRALEKVPFQPAETLYEAMVCWNFIYYMDLCDDIGRLDADLIHLYRGEDMTEVFRCFFKNADANDGWSGSIGPDYNPLTIQVIRACKGIRRPSIELRVKPDMPQEVWDAALDSICAGGGSPTLYNEEAYQRELKAMFPELSDEDRMRSDGGKRGLETEFKNYKGLMPLLEFDEDRLKRITVKPVELGFYHEDKSVKGLPHNANEAVTQEVLETLETLSAEYGTKFFRNGELIEVVL